MGERKRISAGHGRREAALALLLWEEGGKLGLDQAAAQLSATRQQMEGTAADATEARLIERHGSELRLTPNGEQIGRELRRIAIRLASKEQNRAYISFRSYVPEQWP